MHTLPKWVAMLQNRVGGQGVCFFFCLFWGMAPSSKVLHMTTYPEPYIVK